MKILVALRITDGHSGYSVFSGHSLLSAPVGLNYPEDEGFETARASSAPFKGQSRT